MKVHLPLMIQDPMTDPADGVGGGKVFEGIHVDTSKDFMDAFADGPTTSAVAVEDIDPLTGVVRPGARFVPPGKGRVMGRYEVTDDIYSPAFIQASLLGAVVKTMRLFSDETALGRPIRWAFDHPQLRLVPRAGEAADAFYDRDTRSLQFFYFRNPRDPSRFVYTSLSRDIVAHETAHAIIDGIAPALYDTVSPQSLAIHEAMADLAAVMTAFQSNTLRTRVLERTRGSIRDSTAFSSLAPEFGRALDESGRATALRSLWNARTLDTADRSRDASGQPNCVTSDDPHQLSEVLSGALYGVMVRMQEQHWKRYGGDFSSSGRALADALRTFKRLVFRAIDFLPPGEVSFADYGRALVAAERSADTMELEAMRAVEDEMTRRHIVGHVDELERYGATKDTLRRVDPERLLSSDAEAYRFASGHRSLLRIPPRVPITVHPRFYTCKNRGTEAENWLGDNEELLIKVSWEHVEEDTFDRRFPTARSVTCGTTLVLDWNSRKVAAVQTPAVSEQKGARDRMVRRLVEAGLLQPGTGGGAVPGSPVRADVRKGVLKITGAARSLHVQTAGRPKSAPARRRSK